jgi:DNA-binding MarR family transcriptional regulator
MPEQDALEHSTPEQATPGHGAPEHSTPEHGAPGHGAPGHSTPEHGAPGHGAPGHSTPEHGRPERGEWGEPTSGADAERQRLENDFLLAMRRAGSIMQLLGQVSAERIGINVTDLNCLNIVALTGPMTAGDLAKATGLTTASITGVLDRLEEGDFIQRERDPKDRRRVIVNLKAGPGLREIAPTFGPLVKAWRATAAGYSDAELRLLLEFQRKLEDIVRGQLARLRDDLDQHASSRG